MTSKSLLPSRDLRVCQPEDVYGRGFWAQLKPGDLYRPPRKNVVPLKLAKVGRNEPCPCGSGRKSKKCCLAEAA